MSLVENKDYSTICDMLINYELMEIIVIMYICELDDPIAYHQIVLEMSKKNGVISSPEVFFVAALQERSLKLLAYFTTNNCKLNSDSMTLDTLLFPPSAWSLEYVIDNGIISTDKMLELHQIATQRKAKVNAKLDVHIEKLRSHLVSKGIDAFLPNDDEEEEITITLDFTLPSSR